MHVLLEREGWSANINPTQMVSDRVGLDAPASAIFEKFIPSDRSRRIVSTASGVICRFR